MAMQHSEVRNRTRGRLRLRLFRLREDGACLRWESDPEDLSAFIVVPARPRAPAMPWGA